MQLWRRVLRRWPLGLAGIIVVGLAIGGVLWMRRGASPASAEQQLYPVRRGNLVASVAVTGEVYAPRQAELGFDVSRIPLIELHVAPGKQVKAGDPLASVDPTTLERAVVQAEASLTVAQDDLEEVKNPTTAQDLAKAKITVEQAQVDLLAAQQSLEELLNPDLEEATRAVRDASLALQSARTELTATQNDSETAARIRTLEYEAKWYRDNYGEAQVKFQKGQIDQQKLDWEYSNMLAAEGKVTDAKLKAEAALTDAQNQVTKAQEAYQKTADDLAELKAGPSEVDLAKAKNQVDLAELNLEKARIDLADIEAGPDPADIKVAEAKVVSAQATLEDAHAALVAATMTAPFDGTIVSIGAAVGDLMSSGTTVIILADLADLRVMAIVDETDITNVEVGQEVEITFDALPGVRLRGQVQEVPIQGTLSQNILTYEVPVRFEGRAEQSLKPGMTANLNIVVARRQNVLLVPAMAVTRGEEGSTVQVREATQGAVDRPVVVGLSDGTYTEVRDGLNEGDQVVVEYAPTEEQTPRPNAPNQVIPGGGGGRGPGQRQ